MPNPEPYDVYCIRYATNPRRLKSHNHLLSDPHDGPEPIDFFVWAAVNDKRRVLLDIGFTEPSSRERGHDWLRCPVQILTDLGLHPESFQDVVISHMHWDHTGNFDRFPKAQLHIHDREMAYVTGRHMRHAALRRPVRVEDVLGVVRKVFAEQVSFHDQPTELAPGIELHPITGHTPGHMVLRVWTRRGWVVLASDAIHIMRNVWEKNPFPVLYNVADLIEGWTKIDRLASSPDHIIPGHDPLVMQLYPAVRGFDGFAVRLDADPRK